MAYPFYTPTYYPNQNYFPATYQPMVQTMPQQTQQAFPSSQQSFSSSGIIWVDDEREAAMYPIAPNTAVALWEKNGKRAYMKKADASGKPTMTVYDLTERSEQGESEADIKSAFVTKDEICAVIASISDLRSDIDSIKGDLYGAIGKKKVKKNDADDE